MNNCPELFNELDKWLTQASDLDRPNPLAMTLSTATPDGGVSARTVLLKEWSAKGFVFYTNSNSRKGSQLAHNPRVALTLHFDDLGRQILVEGMVEQVPDDLSDRYFATRPRQSNLGAWASRQSEPLASREMLLEAMAAQTVRFAQAEQVRRPPHWHGYLVTPHRVELWQAGEYRLHHRRLFCKTGNQWTSQLLFP